MGVAGAFASMLRNAQNKRASGALEREQAAAAQARRQKTIFDMGTQAIGQGVDFAALEPTLRAEGVPEHLVTLLGGIAKSKKDQTKQAAAGQQASGVAELLARAQGSSGALQQAQAGSFTGPGQEGPIPSFPRLEQTAGFDSANASRALAGLTAQAGGLENALPALQQIGTEIPQQVVKGFDAQRAAATTGENELRKDFVRQSNDFVDQRAAFRRLKTALKQFTHAGDIAVIFNYMKLLDPGSTVREGEAATVAQAGTVPTRVIAIYNNVIRGGKLAPQQRAEISRVSADLFNDAMEIQKGVRDGFAGIAKDRGLTLSNIVGTIGGGGQRIPQPPKQEPRAIFVDFDPKTKKAIFKRQEPKPGESLYFDVD